MTRCKVCPWFGPDDVAWLHAWRHLSPDCRIPPATSSGGTSSPALRGSGTEGGPLPEPAGAARLDGEGA